MSTARKIQWDGGDTAGGGKDFDDNQWDEKDGLDPLFSPIKGSRPVLGSFGVGDDKDISESSDYGMNTFSGLVAEAKPNLDNDSDSNNEKKKKTEIPIVIMLP
jgi:hypothetical protein